MHSSHLILQPTSPKAHVVNESKMMDPHESYHKAINGKDAEKRLKKCGAHCYLTRYSEIRGCYMLSAYQKKPNNVMKHFQISFEHFEDHKVYKIEGKTMEHAGIEEMLRHYENEESRIDPALNSIGKCITEKEYISKTECTII